VVAERVYRDDFSPPPRDTAVGIQTNNVIKFSVEEHKAIKADYAKLSAQADRLLGLHGDSGSDARDNIEAAKPEPPQSDQTSPHVSVLPPQEPEEPIIGEADRGFCNNPGHLTGQSLRRFKDEGSIW
jgi:hypothetical protein